VNARSFHYTALTADGKRRRDTMIAASEQEVFRRLSAARLTPVRVEAVVRRTPVIGSKGVTQSDIAAFTRELSVLVRAKLPLAEGIRSIAEHERKRALRDTLMDLSASIEAGESMTDALKKHKRIFGDLYIDTMRAAERSGNLQDVSTLLATLLERSIESRKQIRRAMTYPMIVISAVALAVGVILIYVVPRFERLFASSNIELPLATQVVQGMGRFASNWWWAVLVGLGVSLVSLHFWVRTKRGREYAERALLLIPYVRSIVIASTAGRFGRVLSIGLGSGMTLMESMTMAGRATGRPLFAGECDEIASGLGRGDRLSDTLVKSRYLPPFARRMLGVGRDADDVAEASQIVAEHYEEESKRLTGSIGTIIEPLLTVLLAGVVLMVALAVFLPMWQIMSMRR